MNKKNYLVLLLIAYINNVFSQDTIYTFHYPKGIVTNNLENLKEKNFRFSPINNLTQEITISKNLVKEIKYLNGTVFTNPEPVENREIILPIDPLTGKIYSTKIIDVNNIKCKDLYNIFKTIPQGEIKYDLIASDESDYSFQKYVGYFNVKFAGDPYIMSFNLLIKFKDGKIKYEYSDFIASFSETRAKGSLNNQALFSTGVYTRTNEHVKILDKMYSGIGFGDEKHFWAPTLNHLNQSIASLEKLCRDAAGFKKDGW